jgi:DNA-directed RNA polymerase specialized sigma24 family protein
LLGGTVSEPDPSIPPQSDEQLLSAALAGQSRAWNALLDQLNPYLEKVIRRRAGDLPDDLQEEIRQETWAAVARRGPKQRADPQEPARRYIRRFLRAAIDRVRSAYRAPGTRSRWRNEAVGWEAPEMVELEALAVFEDEVSAAPIERVEARIEVERRLYGASPLVALAAAMILSRGCNLSEAAGAVGLKRLSLHRGLRALGRRRAA